MAVGFGTGIGIVGLVWLVLGGFRFGVIFCFTMCLYMLLRDGKYLEVYIVYVDIYAEFGFGFGYRATPTLCPCDNSKL